MRILWNHLLLYQAFQAQFLLHHRLYLPLDLVLIYASHPEHS